MAFAPDVKVPEAARLKSLALAGGGVIKLRTSRGAKYVALVAHLGTTAIVGVGKKGNLEPLLYIDIQVRKAKGARLDSFVAIPARARIDDKGTADTADDVVIAYDNPGAGEFYLYDTRKRLYPIDGSRFVIFRSVTVPPYEPFDLTTTSLDFPRLLILGDLVYDDLVVSYGH